MIYDYHALTNSSLSTTHQCRYYCPSGSSTYHSCPAGQYSGSYASGCTSCPSGQTSDGSASSCYSSMPSECSAYSTLSDSNRNVASGDNTILCDSGLSTGWYRFTGSAGTQMPEYVVPSYSCATHASGWLNGAHPAAGVSTGATVCYNWSGNSCSWSTSITVTNCGFYYVYYLSAPPACSLRYCGYSGGELPDPGDGFKDPGQEY